MLVFPPSPTPQVDDDGLSGGQIAGIVIGVLLAILLMVAIIILLGYLIWSVQIYAYEGQVIYVSFCRTHSYDHVTRGEFIIIILPCL